jgi:maleylpyruvate isomerase
MPVDAILLALEEATDEVLADIGTLGDPHVQRPSLLRGWSRGHVLTHLARNAEGGTRLLGWALTGVPSYEYRSVHARAAAIEAGASRPSGALVEDVTTTAEEFGRAAGLLPAEAWLNTVTWTTGQQTTADAIVRARWTEVLIHHVDLGSGYDENRWPPSFVEVMLPRVVDSLNRQGKAPVSAILEVTDSDRELLLGTEAGPLVRLRAPGVQLLLWLLGRSTGAAISGAGGRQLPEVPSVYAV